MLLYKSGREADEDGQNNVCDFRDTPPSLSHPHRNQGYGITHVERRANVCIGVNRMYKPHKVCEGIISRYNLGAKFLLVGKKDEYNYGHNLTNRHKKEKSAKPVCAEGGKP